MIQPSLTAVAVGAVDEAIDGEVGFEFEGVVETGAVTGFDCSPLPAQALKSIPKPQTNSAI